MIPDVQVVFTFSSIIIPHVLFYSYIFVRKLHKLELESGKITDRRTCI